MTRSSTTRGSKKTTPGLRLSADWSFVKKAVKAFSEFQDEPYLKPTSPELGFCFVKTTLGVLQIDIGWLLMLIPGIVRHDINPSEGQGESWEIELTEDDLHETLATIRAIPRYIERDLLGMYIEAIVMHRAKDAENPRLHEIGLDKPYTIEKICKLLFEHGDKRTIVDLELLGQILATGEPTVFSIPEIMDAFLRAISEDGPVGTASWRKFLEQNFRKKRRRGRQREELYDKLFKRRSEDPALTYGKLAAEVAKLKNIEFRVARDQLKAAIAYRRKKAATARGVRS
jgi:hypothetical protein